MPVILLDSHMRHINSLESSPSRAPLHPLYQIQVHDALACLIHIPSPSPSSFALLLRLSFNLAALFQIPALLYSSLLSRSLLARVIGFGASLAYPTNTPPPVGASVRHVRLRAGTAIWKLFLCIWASFCDLPIRTAVMRSRHPLLARTFPAPTA